MSESVTTHVTEGELLGWREIIAFAAASLQCIFTQIPSGDAEVANATRRIHYMVGPPETLLRKTNLWEIKQESNFIQELRIKLFPSRHSSVVPEEEALHAIAASVATQPVQAPTDLGCTHLSRKTYFGLGDGDDDNVPIAQPDEPVAFAKDATTIRGFCSDTYTELCCSRNSRILFTHLGSLSVVAADLGETLQKASTALKAGGSPDKKTLEGATEGAALMVEKLKGSVDSVRKLYPEASEMTWAAIRTIEKTARDVSKPSDLGMPPL